MKPSSSIAEILIIMNVQRIYEVTLPPDKVKTLARRICATWPDITDVVNEWTAENNLQLHVS